MTISVDARSRFEAVLREECLADRSLFDAPGFFDELPLYSRYRQVSFLSRYGNVNELLVELSLGYLQSIVERRRSNAECFAAITVLHHQGAEFLVPCIFFCNGWLNRRLRRLRLTPPTTSFAESVGQLVRNTHSSSEFAVAQDTVTSPGNVRAFLGYRQAPAKHVVALPALIQMLAGAARAAG